MWQCPYTEKQTTVESCRNIRASKAPVGMQNDMFSNCRSCTAELPDESYSIEKPAVILQPPSGSVLIPIDTDEERWKRIKWMAYESVRFSGELADALRVCLAEIKAITKERDAARAEIAQAKENRDELDAELAELKATNKKLRSVIKDEALHGRYQTKRADSAVQEIIEGQAEARAMEQGAKGES
jgi:hypothetical protein